jgi:hypothetical protein
VDADGYETIEFSNDISPPASKTPLRSNLTLAQAPLPSELEGGAPVTVASDDYSVSLA